MSHRLSANDRPILRKLETLLVKFIKPSHRVVPITPLVLQSDYQSVFHDKPILEEINEELSLQKPKQNSIDYNVYMKCFVHELRTPISTISLGLTLLKQNITDVENIQTINDVKKSVIFIENVLTKFASIQDGNIELNVFEPFSLTKLISNVETLILYNLKESGVHLSYYVDPNVVIWNYGDVHNIKHVIINLLKNAIKYREINRTNTITIKIIALPSNNTDKETQSVCISVCDGNNHLLPHIKEHLFETFNSTSGSGMGLYICKNIIELHGGTITHNYIDPIGNEFIITLHLTMCHDSSQHLHTPVSKMCSKKHTTKTNNTYNILLVDDSMLNRKMMSKLLLTNPLFNKIYTAEDGADALTKIKNQTEHIDLVLLDKNMPVMNGWEAVQAMRTISYNKLVIGLTGEDAQEEIQGFIDYGADYVIIKPLDATKIERINAFLKENGCNRLPNKTIQLVNDQLEWV
jgi:signal transduction histidine kinase/CheY-like chemotaxis protein